MGPEREIHRWGVHRGEPPGLEELLGAVARGDRSAFERVYELIAPRVFGLVLRVVRDRAQSEEVAQDVLVEVWRSAARYDPGRGSGSAWVMTIAHRRAVDRVRSAQTGGDREARAARLQVHRPFDEVAESVEGRLERERVRRCLDGLTPLQRESVTFAYYGGYSYREVAELVQAPLATVKTRMRDGLIRLRDCLGVQR
ncbi:ECF RNA polymerase sigma factor SigK [Planomonospora venezuelensis]|uniref:RNA polymerase sigma-70 factor (ECF subfamily) n=1 Tax=Planomonospora venezuelensis TaxID=1999 RepID=A0A841D8P1_PLAVE|nr:ECF RNA polymerase sigma factor SigK [Planomonospora venezuelensis]MBB5967002.1 RNA polymerase sigma-70 factor (ECF subfamily) [Planomonospora venezuelensis]GIN01529.1 RNA polymerase sigma factor SigK [Planomonospora venezuelensis]